MAGSVSITFFSLFSFGDRIDEDEDYLEVNMEVANQEVEEEPEEEEEEPEEVVDFPENPCKPKDYDPTMDAIASVSADTDMATLPSPALSAIRSRGTRVLSSEARASAQ